MALLHSPAGHRITTQLQRGRHCMYGSVAQHAGRRITIQGRWQSAVMYCHCNCCLLPVLRKSARALKGQLKLQDFSQT
eukprot:10343248-Karenia_brevis.AAC.1